jgi:hypothetical protein
MFDIDAARTELKDALKSIQAAKDTLDAVEEKLLDIEACLDIFEAKVAEKAEA